MISQYYPKSTEDIVEFDYLKRGVYEVLEQQLLTNIELITKNLMCQTMTSDAIGAISNIVFGDSSIRDPEAFLDRINQQEESGEERFISMLNQDTSEYGVVVESVTDSRSVWQVRYEDKFRLMFDCGLHIFEELKPKPNARLVRRWCEWNQISLDPAFSKNDYVLNAPQNTWSVMFNKGIHIYDHMGAGKNNVQAGTVDDYSSGALYTDHIMFSGFRPAGLIDVVGRMYSWDALSTLSRVAATLPINLKVMYFGWANGKLGEWDDGEKSMNRNAVCHAATGILVLYGECYD